MDVVNKYTYSYYSAKEAIVLVDIMHPNPLGNPYIIGRDGTREEVINKFEQYARENNLLLKHIKELSENTTLICCCEPYPCHGDVIVKLWKEMHENDNKPT